MNVNSSIPVAVTFSTPVSLNPTSGNVVGITLNYQVFNGSTWESISNVNSGVVGSGSQAAPLVGSNALGSAPNYQFFRSVNTATDTTGNFSSSSNRNIGVNTGLPIMLVTVPEPGTAFVALAGLTYGGYSMFRRRRAR